MATRNIALLEYKINLLLHKSYLQVFYSYRYLVYISIYYNLIRTQLQYCCIGMRLQFVFKTHIFNILNLAPLAFSVFNSFLFSLFFRFRNKWLFMLCVSQRQNVCQISSEGHTTCTALESWTNTSWV